MSATTLSSDHKAICLSDFLHAAFWLKRRKRGFKTINGILKSLTVEIYSQVFNTRRVFLENQQMGALIRGRGRKFILEYRQSKKVFLRYSNKSPLHVCNI